MSGVTDAFERASKLLAEKTGLTGPQARGSIRLALKDGGLDAREVSPAELAVVFLRLMPKRLEAQGLTGPQAQSLCGDIAALLASMREAGSGAAAATMFDRLDDARRG